MSDTVLYETKGAVAFATLNRPHVLNAINNDMLRQLISILENVAGNDEIGVLVLTGSGRAFSAGGDIKDMHGASKKELEECLDLFQLLSHKMHYLSKPIIAAINGYALAGGFELALSCDLRIASEKSQFSLPDAKIGLSPTSAMTYLLPRIIGMGRAMHLILTGEMINAVEAERIGLATIVVDQDHLMEETEKLAQNIASMPRLGVAYSKREFHMAAESTFANTLTFEKEFEMHCFNSPETQQALADFVENK